MSSHCPVGKGMYLAKLQYRHVLTGDYAVQQIADQSGVGPLPMYICRYDMPPSDINSGPTPPPPPHLQTVLKVLQQCKHVRLHVQACGVC